MTPVNERVDRMPPEETRLPTAAEWPAIASLWKRTGRELVARFGGSSMQPTIPPETEVLLRCGEDAAPGDVVAFLAHDQVILHRVEATGTGWILTRGDGQIIPDAPIVDRDAVLGRVVQIRGGPRWSDPPEAPHSWWRQVVLRLCVGSLRVSPSAGAAFVGLLLAGRRWTSAIPRAIGRRLG